MVKKESSDTAKVETSKTSRTRSTKKKADVITIKLVRSFSGRLRNQIATAKSLGLRRIGDVVTQPDNEATRGKIAKISHMVEILNR